MDMTRLGYEVQADPALWIPVPLSFPTEEWTSREQFLDELPRRLAADFGDAPEREEWLRGVAAAILAVPVPFEAVRERFWYFPIDRPQVAIAHLTVVPREILGSDPLDVLVLSGGDTLVGAQRLERLPSESFDEVVLGLETHESGVEAPRDADTDAATEDSADSETAPPGIVGVARLAGEIHGMVFLLEVVDPDLVKVGEMLDDLQALLESISIGEVPA